ncbi:universal stress protein [Sphingomonas qomolangmaensis]|uniref:Universal stress protein n=1 Tax=Sphingomonas qomolangmaensis TaxID=2918765 RepID=A0ABY5LBF1_9SPHN|nr:universal stress protein [Sphingomonas qomolangmaensis]UUL83145.1 universal stress protein [Sphingomonas qomolangmaensis]
MKNVLVLLHDDPGQEARFQTALDITRALNGHLTCIDVAVAPIFVGDYADMGGTALLMADEQQRESANRTRMEARLRVEDVPYTWRDARGFLGQCVRDAAVMTDLIVLNRELDDILYPDMLELVGEVLVKTGRPIMAVPATTKRFDAFGSALLAWDGSPQSEAALRAAIPLLEHGRMVTILEIDDGSLKVPATEAATYLSRHGIKSMIRRHSSLIDLPSALILATAAELGVAYVVMGGFGHSRFVEATFGGVTRRMLKQCPVPIFLAH